MKKAALLLTGLCFGTLCWGMSNSTESKFTDIRTTVFDVFCGLDLYSNSGGWTEVRRYCDSGGNTVRIQVTSYEV